jgi:hypothetical protein
MKQNALSSFLFFVSVLHFVNSLAFIFFSPALIPCGCGVFAQLTAASLEFAKRGRVGGFNSSPLNNCYRIVI